MANLPLEGSVAVVSGANHGIGAATAIQFAREGASVAVLDRDVPALLRESGMEVLKLRSYYAEHFPKPPGYFYEGRAVA